MIVGLSRVLVGEIALCIAAVLIVISALGVVRFPDTLSRMHALSKASTAGVALALFGVATTMSRLDDVMSLGFAALLYTVTNPVASTLLTKATYREQQRIEQSATVTEVPSAATGGSAEGDG